MIKTFLLCSVTAGLLLGAFYIGISRDLCKRDNISPSEYAEMKLECNSWLYR
jgi:hypothetical protein